MKNKMERKVTVNDQEIDIYVLRPNNQIIRDADRVRLKVWSDCANDGIPTKQQVAKMMRERGVWDDDKDKEETEITAKVIVLEKELYHGKKGGKKPKLSEGRDLAIEIRRARLQLRDLISERIALEENSAESLADNARFDYLVAHCTYYADGRRVYKDFDDYNKKSADSIAFTAASVIGEMIYNLDSSFEDNLPENQFLKKYGLVNDDLSLIDPNDGFTVDTDGKRIDEEGYYLNDDGKRVDREGNIVLEDGNYELVEYENDLVKSKPKRKKRTTKKVEPKPETEPTASDS